MEVLYWLHDVVKRKIVVVGKMVQASNHDLQVKLAPKGESKKEKNSLQKRKIDGGEGLTASAEKVPCPKITHSVYLLCKKPYDND